MRFHRPRVLAAPGMGEIGAHIGGAGQALGLELLSDQGQMLAAEQAEPPTGCGIVEDIVRHADKAGGLGLRNAAFEFSRTR